jgi:hypothetical protein
MPTSTDLLQGTLDLLILQTLSLQPMHGWGVAQRISAGFKGRFADRTGLTLSSALPAGIQGLDQIDMGKLGK